ncbi:MAG: UDP-N-acetylglucosamine--N-acetylmuramyl-(pentapeptide) pyrophosphoryl-undecaprenol N-acetylglucosamine transferase [Patescibacteria group bacterium]
MKILLTGGGTGGHFYPLIAVARALKNRAEAERIVEMNLIFASPSPFDETMLREEGITFIKTPAGKIRRYFSLLNILDPFKTVWGIVKAMFAIYLNFPDVVFSKGGHGSVPALVAARVFGIPVLIHESDVVPGKVSAWSAKFARRIAVAFPQAAKYFPAEKVAYTGNPVRREVIGGSEEEAAQIFNLEPGLKTTILVLGGSQGAAPINDTFLDILPELVKTAQVIHQAGVKNLKETEGRAEVVLANSEFKRRYHPVAFLDEGALRNASKAATLVVARASAGFLFELALWGRPAILIPLPHAAQDHQRENAYAYARAGAAVVLEEQNVTPHILLAEIQKVLANPDAMANMSKSAQLFAKADAAEKIADEIIQLALEHS